jgi:prepilin signal peptidase PulO-like enzyme (type II secretory pathway)
MYGDDLKKLPIMIVLMLLVFLFMIIANIDYETHYIYSITLVIFAVFALFITLYKVFMFEVNIWPYIIGAAFGFGFFLLIKVLAKLAMKKDALGSGDVYLVGIAGFLLGIFPLLLAILIATLLGSIIEVTKIKLKKQSRESEIAFGPYLLLGIGILAIYGDAIMDLYWKVMS